jgi:sphingosine kinase
MASTSGTGLHFDTTHFSLTDLVGSVIVKTSETWVVCAICYPYSPAYFGCCARGCVPQPQRVRAVHTVACVHSAAEAEKISKALSWAARDNQAIDLDDQRPLEGPSRRRLLVFLNPRSGPGRGPRQYRAFCANMLADAGCDVDVVETQRALEATDTLRTMPAETLLRYDGVLAGGGDGMMHEVLQGVLGRPDGASVAAALTVGVLPLGSGNGMSASLCAAAGLPFSLSNATLLIAKNHRSPLDVASVFCRGGSSSASILWGRRYFSFLSTAWGLIADADIESEVLRCAGALRTDLWVALRVLTLRQYRGSLWILPASDSDQPAQQHVHSGASHSGVWPPPPFCLQPFDAALGTADGWLEIPGPFLALWILSTTHQSIGVAGAPESSHDDGVLTAVIVKSHVGRLSLARLMLSLDGNDFESFIRAHPEIAEVHRCRAFRIVMDPSDPMKSFGHVVIDGEDAEYGDVQGEVHAGLLRVFGPAPGRLPRLTAAE